MLPVPTTCFLQCRASISFGEISSRGLDKTPSALSRVAVGHANFGTSTFSGYLAGRGVRDGDGLTGELTPFLPHRNRVAGNDGTTWIEV